MKIVIKTFSELNLGELYQLLQLRSEVFVVEQDCVYQDIDGKDQLAFHVLGFKEKILVAYARYFEKGFYFKEASIGRVLVREDFRNLGYGHQILEVTIKALTERYRTARIKVSAQKYLIHFYNSYGFVEIGEGYLEDGIPHIAMIKEG